MRSNFEKLCKVKRDFNLKGTKKRGVVSVCDNYLSYIVFTKSVEPVLTIDKMKMDKRTVFRDLSSFRPNIHHKLKKCELYPSTFIFNGKRLKAVQIDKVGDFWYCPLA